MALPRKATEMILQMAGFDIGDFDEQLVAIDVINKADAESHIPDPNLPVIDLKKEQKDVPGVAIYSHDWKLQVMQQTGLEIYNDNCTGYEFKDGQVYLTFRIDTKTAKQINYSKSRVGLIRIVHYDLAQTPPIEVLVMSYYVKFMHLEMLNDDEKYLSMTMVYKLLEER